MVLAESLTLAKFGYNNTERASSFQNFSRQLESYALHVIEDRPVSNLYSYYVDGENIFIDKEKQEKLYVDPEERDNLSALGTRNAIGLALSHPGRLVLFYSPPGPVAFSTGTKYDKIKPYTDGQLYLLTSNTANQVDTIAISVGEKNEGKTLDAFFGPNKPTGFDDEIEKIKYYLSNPLISNLQIDELLDHVDNLSSIKDFLVYKNVHTENYYLSDVLSYLKQGWLGKIRPRVNLDYHQLFKIAQMGKTEDAYKHELQMFFPVYEEGGILKLGGGCGGETVTKGDLDGFDPLQGIRDINPLSTDYRLKTSAKDILNNKDERYKDYQCPDCGKTYRGEIKGSDKSTWQQTCIKCGHKFNC